MPWFKCDKCGYTLQAAMPPDDAICPSCQQKCTFKDVTCYVPECGLGDGHEHIDHRLQEYLTIQEVLKNENRTDERYILRWSG